MNLNLPEMPDLSQVPVMARDLLAQWDQPPAAPEDIGSPLLWTLFGTFVVIALFIDFSAMRRQGAHKVSLGEAALWSLIWIAASMAFMAFLWWRMGGGSGDPALEAFAQHKALEFLTGYLVEKALAVDNIFVFLMLFTYFAVPAEYQKRALMIGILAALVLRGSLILVGAWLINEFHWVLYIFGGFLVFTGFKMWMAAGKEADLDSNPALDWVRRTFAISPTYNGEKFFTRHNGRGMATPLLVVVLLIGIVDVVFAVDSIPAIFAITTDPFIVLTSNVMAILGLRAMYFLLAGVHERFHLLPYGLALVLVLIGVKMLLIDLYKIPIQWSLGATAVILTVTVLLSLMIKPKSSKPHGAFPFEGKEKPEEPRKS